jgi:predicted house-cleaning NTP pyrophosphatase (Maf/HAM1 superfamily)
MARAKTGRQGRPNGEERAGGRETPRHALELVLASASPRRARILASLGVAFEVVVSHVDERLLKDESAETAAERLARAKALSVAATTDLPVLAADTLVVLGGRVLEIGRAHV